MHKLYERSLYPSKKSNFESRASIGGIDIYLSPPEFDAAVKLGREMDATVGNDFKGDPNGFGVPDRYVLGMLGEFAFAQMLRNFGLRFEWDPRATGKSDNGDFTLFYKGKPFTIDVKTLRGHRQSIMLSQREYDKQHTNWRYAAVRQHGGERYYTIHGICSYGDFYQRMLDDGKTVYERRLGELKGVGALTANCDMA